MLTPLSRPLHAVVSETSISINGQSVASVKVLATQFALFSADETASVGVDLETPVSEDYDSSNSEFTGKIHKIAITLK